MDGCKSCCQFSLIIVLEILAVISCVALVYSLFYPMLFTIKPLNETNADFHVGLFRYTTGNRTTQISDQKSSYTAFQSFLIITTVSACVTTLFALLELCIRSLTLAVWILSSFTTIVSIVFTALYTNEYIRTLNNKYFSFSVSVTVTQNISKETFRVPYFLYASYIICGVFLSLSLCIGLKKKKVD
ncbi:hypothetical protein MXB_461 [Myxobolus squamalis]|nr:hypothetical protein MXB_461 [Myxobolus squamalis]